MIVNAVQQPRIIRTDHCPPVVGDFNKGTFRGSNEGRSLTLGTMTERWAREEATAKGFSSEGEKRVLVAGGECEAQWGVFMRKTWVWWHQMKCWWERTGKEAEVNMTEEREGNFSKEVKSRQSEEILHCDRRAGVCHSLAPVQPAE